MKESTVETYFNKQVRAAGGDTRKMKGRINDCDRLAIWPRLLVKALPGPQTRILPDAEVHFVELKRPNAKPRAGQAREHARLRKLGCKVFVISTKAQVDAYVADNK